MYEKRGNKEGFDEYYLLQANQQLNNQSCLAEYKFVMCVPSNIQGN